MKHTSVRLVLALVAHSNMELEQMDVKTTFLHGDLEPEGFTARGDEDKVCLLKKSLYRLKQSQRQWYNRFDDCILSFGFKRCSYDSCVYFRREVEEVNVFLLLYVDVILIASKSKEEISEIKKLLSSKFEMKDLGYAKQILGM